MFKILRLIVSFALVGLFANPTKAAEIHSGERFQLTIELVKTNRLAINLKNVSTTAQRAVVQGRIDWFSGELRLQNTNSIIRTYLLKEFDDARSQGFLGFAPLYLSPGESKRWERDLEEFADISSCSLAGKGRELKWNCPTLRQAWLSGTTLSCSFESFVSIPSKNRVVTAGNSVTLISNTVRHPDNP